MAEARLLQQQGDVEESVEILRAYLVDHPRDGEAHYRYGWALSVLVRPSEAQFPLREAIKDPDWLIPAATLLAQNAISTRNYHSALQAAQAILDQEPDHLEGLRLRATAHITSRKGYAEALVDIDRIAELDPTHPHAGVLRAIALLGLDRIEEAEEQLLQSAEEGRDTTPELQATYCVAMIEFFIEAEDFDEADRQIARCRELYPKSAEVLSVAVERLEAQGHSEKGLELLREVLEARPENLEVRLAIVARLRAAGRSEDAEALLLEAVREGEGRHAFAARYELVDFYRSQGRLEDAADTLSTAVNQLETPPGPKLQLSLVELLVAVGRFEEAESITEQIADPAFKAFGKGYVAVFRGDYPRALDYYSQGYKTWPDNAGARYYGAYAAEQLGLFDRAIAEYRYSIRIDSTATDARLRLARILLHEGQPKVALESITVDESKNALNREEALLSIEAALALGRVDRAQLRLRALSGDPVGTFEGIAAIANAIARRSTPIEGASFIELSGVDLTDPRAVEALRTYVVLKGETAEASVAAALVAGALKRSPRVSALHEIRGRLLERFGSESSMASEAYERAIQLDPTNALAELGIARIHLGQRDALAALEAYRRAHEADPERAGIATGYAKLLSEQKTVAAKGTAISVLESALESNPTDWRVAVALGRLLAKEDPTADRPLELAQRARRFRGGAPALELLALCQEARGQTEEAAQTRKRAAELSTASEQPDLENEVATDPQAKTG